MIKTCKIQWIDEDGRMTPDNNPAIGEVYVIAHRKYAESFKHGYADCEESAHYPICAEHMKRFNDPGMEYWRFEPYEETVDLYRCCHCGNPGPIGGHESCHAFRAHIDRGGTLD